MPTRPSPATPTGRRTGGGRDDTPFEPGVARRRGGPPAPKPTRPVTGRVDMSGRLPAAEPGRSGTAPGGRRCAASRRRRPTSSVAKPPRASTPTGPLDARPAAPLPAAAAAVARRTPRRQSSVRQVPRSHARADRGVRAVVHRLGRGHRQSRSGPGRCRAGHPVRSRPTRRRPQDHPTPDRRGHSA